MASKGLKHKYRIGQAIKVKIGGFIYVGRLKAIAPGDEYPLKVLFPAHSQTLAAKIVADELELYEREVYRG